MINQESRRPSFDSEWTKEDAIIFQIALKAIREEAEKMNNIFQALEEKLKRHRK